MKNIYFTEDGDFLLRQGEVVLAKATEQECFLNTILHRLQTGTDDWNFENTDLVELYNVDIKDFLSSKVTKRLIGVLKFLITSILTQDGLLEKEEIVIYDLPINYNTLLLKMSILSKDENKKPISIDMTYDLRSNRIIPKILNVPEGEIWQN